MSDVEFVNAYMGKLKDHLNDQLTKIIMLETHLELAGNGAKSLQEEVEAERVRKEEIEEENKELLKKLDDAEDSYKDALNKAELLYAEKESLNINIADLNAEIDRLKPFESLKGEVAALRSQVNTLNDELASARLRESTMVMDYQKLSKEKEAVELKFAEAKQKISEMQPAAPAPLPRPANTLKPKSK